MRPGWLPAPRRRGGRGCGQSGQSLVEVVVASALLGIGVVAGLAAMAAGVTASRRAEAQGMDGCLVRVEAEYVEGAPFVDASAGSPYPAPPGVTVKIVDVTPASVTPSPGNPRFSRVTISHGGYSVDVYKLEALSPTYPSPGPGPSPWPTPAAGDC